MVADRHDGNDKLADDSIFLAVVIGNTTTYLATLAGGKVKRKRGVPTSDEPAVREALGTFRTGLPSNAPTVVASVVPEALERLRKLAKELDAAPVLAIGRDVALPIELAVERPDRVGVDRVCCAAGAFARTGTACVVADFGTALTVDLVGDDGVFIGGTILPGMQLAARALSEHTAQLPLVDVGRPDDVVGTDTVAAIRAGIFYGMIGALREIVERIATRVGRWPTLIATGGDAEAIASAGDFVDIVAPDLIFDGIASAYAKHQERSKPS